MSIPVIFMSIPAPEGEYSLAYVMAWESTGPAIDYPLGYKTILSTSPWNEPKGKDAFFGPEIW